jgi:hypothetical protein
MTPGAANTYDNNEQLVTSLTKTVHHQQVTIEQLMHENNKLKQMLESLSRQQTTLPSMPYPVSAKAYQILHGKQNDSRTSFDTYISNMSMDSYESVGTPVAGGESNVDIFEQAGIKSHLSKMWVPQAEKKKKRKRRDSINALCSKVREALCFSANLNKSE